VSADGQFSAQKVEMKDNKEQNFSDFLKFISHFQVQKYWNLFETFV
jgi:hypothetical protein